MTTEGEAQELIHGCSWQQMDKRAKELMLGLVDVMKNGRLEETVDGYIRVEGKEG